MALKEFTGELDSVSSNGLKEFTGELDSVAPTKVEGLLSSNSTKPTQSGGVSFDEKNGMSSVSSRAMDLAAQAVASKGAPEDSMAKASEFLKGSGSPLKSEQDRVTIKPEQTMVKAAETVAKTKSEQDDFLRGAGNTFRQLPQLLNGLVAGEAAIGEKVFGKGGAWTGAKTDAVMAYKSASEDLAANSEKSDSLSYSWDQAKQGDYGSLVDWLQYGLGYSIGQGAQMLATGGIGSVAGKTALKGIAEKTAQGMIANEIASISTTTFGKAATAEAVKSLAVSNVASKIGQNVAIGSAAFGMEGGEIFGDLVSKNPDASGAQLAKAFAATLIAGGLEFAGDKIGIRLMLGKGVGKIAKSRAVNAAAGGAAGAIIEGGTEYFQTGVEEYGKGAETAIVPFMQSKSAQTQAFDAAGLGALGGAAMGGVGGSLKKAELTPSETLAGLIQTGVDNTSFNNQDAVLGALAPNGILRQRATQDLAKAPTVDAAIDAAHVAVSTPMADLSTIDRLVDQKDQLVSDEYSKATRQSGYAAPIAEPSTEPLVVTGRTDAQMQDEQTLLAQAAVLKGTATNAKFSEDRIEASLDDIRGESQSPAVEEAPQSTEDRPAGVDAPEHIAALATAPGASDVRVHTASQLGNVEGTTRTTKSRAAIIERTAKMFGRNVVFYSSATPMADGMYDSGTNLYVNIDSGVDPMAVAGHEFRHSLKGTPGHAAINKAAAKILAQGDTLVQFANSYLTAPDNKPMLDRVNAGTHTEADAEFLAEEYGADITGNMWRDPAALKDIFDHIAAEYPVAKARALIGQIGDAVVAFINKMLARGGFQEFVSRDELIEMKTEIKNAMRDAYIATDRAKLTGKAEHQIDTNGWKFAPKVRKQHWSDEPTGKPVSEKLIKVNDIDESRELASSQIWRKGRDLKIALDARIQMAAKAAKVDLSEKTPETLRFLKNRAVAEIEAAIKTNPGAIGWYDETVNEAFRILGHIHPELNTDPSARFAFTWALAVTSNGLKVDKNFELAERAYESYKSTGKMPTNIGIGNAAEAINNSMVLFNKFKKSMTLEQMQSFMTTKTTVKSLISDGYKISGEGTSTEVFGAAILGAKIGNGFFMNLYGEFGQLTMDRWLMRTFGRWTGTLVHVDRDAVIEKRAKLKAIIASMSLTERKQFAKVLGVKTLSGNIDDIGALIQKKSMKPELRVMMSAVAPRDAAAFDEFLGKAKANQVRTSAGDELRKMGNGLTMSHDGQKEAPAGSGERDFIRAMFAGAMKELVVKYPDLTVADAQALLWYPEKKLYELAKVDDTKNDYEDDEAPDYANAAAKLARAKGISFPPKTAGRAADVRSGKREQQSGSDSPKYSQSRILFEVAPDPHDAELTTAWNKQSNDEKIKLSNDVAETVVKKLLDQLHVKGEMSLQIGGYMGESNPSFTITLENGNPDEVAKAAGFVLSQDMMIAVSETPFNGGHNTGAVTFNLNGDDASEVYKKIYAGVPEAEGHTAVDGVMTIINNPDLGISTADLANKIDRVLNNVYHMDVWNNAYASFPTKEEYGYVSDNKGHQGSASGSPAAQGVSNLRAETNRLIAEKLGINSGQSPNAVSGGSTGVTPDSKGVKARGVHYSKEQRNTLNSSAFGSGLKGEELDRVRNAADERIKHRVYFYVNGGRGINPESGVGAHAHEVDLNNLYDIDANPMDLSTADKNMMESRILDAGFDGYVSPERGIAIMLGRRAIPVEYKGTGRPEVAPAERGQKSAYGQQQAEVNASKSLPAGQMKGSDWKRMMKALMPHIDVSHLNDDTTYYRSEIVAKPKMSPIRDTFHAKVNEQYEAAKVEYASVPGTEGGRLLNTDLARELSEDYRADRTLSAEVHEPSSAFIKKLYADLLAQDTPDNKVSVVLFMAGGTGAGKSSSLVIPSIASIAKKAEIVYDSTMSKFKSSVEKIDQALAAGRGVWVNYVYRDPVDSLVNGALPRAMVEGRTAPLSAHHRTHVGSNKVIHQLAEHYAGNPRVGFKVVDNSRGRGNQTEIDLTSVTMLNDNEVKEKLNHELEKEYQAGRISESIYKATKGQEDDGRGVSEVRKPSDSRADQKPQTENKLSTARFYSQLSKSVESAPDRMFTTGKATATWLQANTSKLGIKSDELYWSGALDWLNTQPRVSKTDVVSFLKGNGVKVREVELSREAFDPESPTYPAGMTVEPITDDERNEEGGPWKRNDYVLRDVDGRAIGLGNSWSEAINDGYDAYPEKFEDTDSTKFSDYQLPGGENYRELLLTSPGAGYKSSHYSERGIIAHIRMNERTDSTGAKVLFLEEIQGDWPQAYKKQQDLIKDAVDNDFLGIIDRMKKAGVLEVNCD